MRKLKPSKHESNVQSTFWRMKLTWIIHTYINSVSTWNNTYRISITKSNRLMPFRKITALSSDSPTEQAKLYGQNSRVLPCKHTCPFYRSPEHSSWHKMPRCDKAAGLWAMIKSTLWTVVYKVITYVKLHYRLTPTDDLLVAHLANFS